MSVLGTMRSGGGVGSRGWSDMRNSFEIRMRSGGESADNGMRSDSRGKAISMSSQRKEGKEQSRSPPRFLFRHRRRVRHRCESEERILAEDGDHADGDED